MRTFESSDPDSPSDYIERTPPPRRPPPPPPPPRLSCWILHVRLRNGEVRKIQVDPSTWAVNNLSTFGQYLQHGLNLDYVPSGLFQNDVFVSLQHILKLRDPQEQSQLFAVHCQPPPEPDVPWYQRWTLDGLVYVVTHWIVPIILLYYLYAWNLLGSTLLYTGVILVQLADLLVEQPLNHLYHHGPWYLGFWEGEPLPTICARLTYHGDASFWYRNLADCQVIFDTKRTAWLHIARPVTYIILLGILLSIIIMIVREWRKPPPMNRDMVDLYRAFNIIVGQVQRRGALGREEYQQRHHPHAQ